MAVITSFTSDVQAGLSPFTVTFTDTSTGSPTAWLWDFGDGTFSTSQHPTHEYTGTAGDKWDVTLTAWIGAGSTTTNMTQSDSNKKWKQEAGYWPETNAQVHTRLLDNLSSPGWTTPTVDDGSSYWNQHRVSPDGIRYKIRKRLLSLTTDTEPSVTVLEVMFNISTILEGSVIAGSFGTLVAQQDSVWWPFASPAAGTAFGDMSFEPIGGLVPPIITGPTSGGVNGFVAAFRKITYNVLDDDSDNKDSLLESDFIQIGLPPVAAFEANPTSGRNPLFVTFHNLSTLAVGAPTTFIWKRRVSGSGASFVQFSTAESPVELFDKDSP